MTDSDDPTQHHHSYDHEPGGHDPGEFSPFAPHEDMPTDPVDPVDNAGHDQHDLGLTGGEFDDWPDDVVLGDYWSQPTDDGSSSIDDALFVTDLLAWSADVPAPPGDKWDDAVLNRLRDD
jgi:hypothetical protein